MKEHGIVNTKREKESRRTPCKLGVPLQRYFSSIQCEQTNPTFQEKGKLKTKIKYKNNGVISTLNQLVETKTTKYLQNYKSYDFYLKFR